MVGLVLDDPRGPAGELLVQLPPRLVLPAQPDPVRAADHGLPAGDAQAPLEERRPAVADRFVAGVDQHPVRLRHPAARLAHLGRHLRRVLDHRQPQRHTDLRGREPHSGRGVHGLPHRRQQPVQLARGQLALVRQGRLPQHGDARGEDRQRAGPGEQFVDELGEGGGRHGDSLTDDHRGRGRCPSGGCLPAGAHHRTKGERGTDGVRRRR
ncbi:hypothetical protein Z951_14890 [Streptomyces sp. PRh5]|nr:hypothetical protein Z951_14890 [Streptomyces sp. PRh5]